MVKPFKLFSLIIVFGGVCSGTWAADWPQYKFDSEHSGNAPGQTLRMPLGLVAAIRLTDAVFTSPAVAGGRIYVLDGAGVLHCIDADTHGVLWRFTSAGGKYNCNNYSSPVVARGYVHFGTMTGDYYVLDAATGAVVKRISCGEPIFSCPVVNGDTVYFVTLGSRVYAVTPRGEIKWKWDYVREVLKFEGDRWSGQAWLRHKKSRVTWREQFLCSRNMAAHGRTLVIPAGGTIVWLQDNDRSAKLLGGYVPNESPATLGMSLGADGAVYRQWFRRDNTGRIEILRWGGSKVQDDFVRGTETSWQSNESMGFASVSPRGDAVYRCRPERRFGFCVHAAGKTTPLADCPSIAPPILAGQDAVISGLDGRLTVVPLRENAKSWSFTTPFGRPITAPAAVANGRIIFGGEDGYLYILGPNGHAQPPTQRLPLERIRSPLTTDRTDSRYDWSRHFHDQANTNRTLQNFELPLAMHWIRRCEGTIKHLSTCGGGRIYTHTAEGQIMAVEQETGRLLWRVYYPGVHVSFTTPAYENERLYLPQAGLDHSYIRCLDAATGKLIWQVPFSGSPSWNRQLTPLIHKNLVLYQFSTGRYTGRTWLFEHQSTFGFSDDQRPIIKAWDRATGRAVWSLDFSKYGHGGDDAGMCLQDGVLYYSCYFGNKRNKGVTAAIDPETGKIRWVTTKYAVHAGCAPSVHGNHLYLGGYNAVEGKINRVWCLNTEDGSLIWKSDPVLRAIHVLTIAGDRLFTHAQYKNGYLLDAATGKKLCELTHGYRCTRFTMAGPFLLGPNMDVIDTAHDNRLVSTGPAVDVLLCVSAQVSNGRLFYTANGSGLQCSAVFGKEARAGAPGAWQKAEN